MVIHMLGPAVLLPFSSCRTLPSRRLVQLISLRLDLANDVQARVEEPIHAVFKTPGLVFRKLGGDTAGYASSVRVVWGG